MQDQPDGMTMADRLRLACEMHDLGVAMMRQNLKRRHPQASASQIAAMLADWLQTRPGAEFGDASGPDFRARAL